MSKTIKSEKLSEEIIKTLTDYIEDIEEVVIDTTNTLTKEAVNELKRTSPKGKESRKTQYYKGWTYQKGKENKGKYTIKIHNKTNYQLTHLLEFGHITRNGTRTKENPHIRPLEKKYNEFYEQKLTTAIKRRQK